MVVVVEALDSEKLIELVRLFFFFHPWSYYLDQGRFQSSQQTIPYLHPVRAGGFELHVMMLVADLFVECTHGWLLQQYLPHDLPTWILVFVS